MPVVLATQTPGSAFSEYTDIASTARLATLDSTNLLDVFRHKLGEPSLSAVFRDGSLMKTAVREIFAAYNEWEQPTAPPPKVAGELRPVFAPSALSPHYESDELLNSLLLVHSVAIVVPDSINYATRLVSLLANLEEAVDAGLVHVLSERVLNEPPSFFDQLLEENVGLVLPDSLSLDERVVRVGEFIDVADIALTLDACASHPDKLDLACRTRGQRDWLRARIHELPPAAIKSQDSLAYMSELLALRLPAAKVPISDMLALRAEGAFDRWRKALTKTIEEVTAMDDDVFLDPASGRTAAMRERMTAAAEDMASESFGRTRNGAAEVTTFGIACAGGAGGFLVGGPIGAGAVAGGAYLTTTLVDWLRARPAAGDKAVRRMVTELFVEPPR